MHSFLGHFYYLLPDFCTMRNKQANCCAEPPGAPTDYSSLSHVYLDKAKAAAESTAQTLQPGETLPK